ncbi:golgin subfamily A member 6-like protein 25 [Phymastichus coffea]|uniref:golgin subfamily A member 6-like protein 25 n=1 Tax=Phymastichus coffea TaxID=108790 RepID=UPI00273BE06B|nr:golgin subfamily A member 6-like protein 25 [Phymastichus coffea]
MEEQRRIDEQAVEQAKETVRRVVEKFDGKLAEMEKRMEERMREQEERLEAKMNKPKRNGRCRREEEEKENESAEHESNVEQEREETQRPDDDQQGTRDRSNAEGGEEPKVNKPDAMKLGEYECEMKERRSRKNNVFIRGVRTSGKRLKEEIEGIILGTTRKQYNIEKMKLLRGGLLLTFEHFRDKIEFMEQAEDFEKIGIRVEEERTPIEIEVQEWIETIAEQKRKKHNQVQVGYLKIIINGRMSIWDERRGNIVETTERMFFPIRREGEEQLERRGRPQQGNREQYHGREQNEYRNNNSRR